MLSWSELQPPDLPMSHTSKTWAWENVCALQSEQSVPFVKGCSGSKSRGNCRLFPNPMEFVSHALKKSTMQNPIIPEHYAVTIWEQEQSPWEPARTSDPSETTLVQSFQADTLGRLLPSPASFPPPGPQLTVFKPPLPPFNSSLAQECSQCGPQISSTCNIYQLELPVTCPLGGSKVCLHCRTSALTHQGHP